jgi:hypothetical protein
MRRLGPGRPQRGRRVRSLRGVYPAAGPERQPRLLRPPARSIRCQLRLPRPWGRLWGGHQLVRPRVDRSFLLDARPPARLSPPSRTSRSGRRLADLRRRRPGSHRRRSVQNRPVGPRGVVRSPWGTRPPAHRCPCHQPRSGRATASTNGSTLCRGLGRTSRLWRSPAG